MEQQQQQRQARAHARKKRLSGERRDFITCATRAVELTTTQAERQESSKLLFMLSLGLSPNDKRTSGAVVKINRLSPKVEADARARTKAALMELARKLLQKREQISSFQSIFCDKSVTPEIIDLVSSDDEESETMTHCAKVPAATHQKASSSSLQTLCRVKHQRALHSSPDLRKPLKNSNQVSKTSKSKSISRLGNLKQVQYNSKTCTKYLQKSQAKLQPSSKFLAKSPTVTVTRSQPKFPLRICEYL